MTILPELRARTEDGAGHAPDSDILWHHSAFCRFALPAEPGGRGAWQREVAGAGVTIEPGSAYDRLPGGPWLRRLLMFLCDSAQRSGEAQVVLGDDATALATAIDPQAPADAAAALEQQVAGLLACRIQVAVEGGPALGVLDARGRPRAVSADWRTTVRLSARFLDSLGREKVALDRRVVAQLSDSALALDIYAWLAYVLPQQTDAVLAEAWPDLRRRFGATGQDADAFQAACGTALAQLRAACPGLEIDEDAIGVGFSARSASAAAPVPEPPAADPAPPPPPPPPAAPPPAPEVPVAPPPAAPPPEIAAGEPLPAESAGEGEPGTGRRLRQTISLRSHVTGLSQVVWLQRAQGRDTVVIEVTPGSRYDPALVTVLALEPIVLQIAGGLHTREFERVASWANANRDLIDDFWEGQIDSFDEIVGRVRKVPPPGWR